MNRRMPNGMYGGVRGERKAPLLDWGKSGGQRSGPGHTDPLPGFLWAMQRKKIVPSVQRVRFFVDRNPAQRGRIPYSFRLPTQAFSVFSEGLPFRSFPAIMRAPGALACRAGREPSTPLPPEVAKRMMVFPEKS